MEFATYVKLKYAIFDIHGDEYFKSYFFQDGDLVYCNDINSIMKILEIEFDSFQWRLHIE